MFFSLFAAGGAKAGQGNGKGQGNGNANGGQQSQQSKAKQSDAKEDNGGTANSKAQKTPNRTLNDHPSGKDRTGSAGGSGTQGKSTSDPDGMSNGGADKPGGTGGFDADKDGNNGCGNDDDFEDDNNGWCGKPSDVDRDLDVEEEDDVLVRGVTFNRTVGGDTQVRGAVFTRAAPTTLAATGANVSTLLAFGFGLLLVGTAAVMAAGRFRLQPVRVRTTD